MNKDVKIKDVIITKNVFTNTNYNNFYINNGEGYINGSANLVQQAQEKAKELNLNYHIGDTLCSDTFYTDENEIEKAQKNNLLGVEMEGAALYLNAQRLNKDALVICTVSNNLITGEETTSEERQNSFTDMIKLALELA